MAIPLLEGQEAEYVLTDKGYDSDEIVDAVEAMNAEPVISPRSHRKTQRFYDKNIYKERSAIECTFGKLKQFRRIATRYDSWPLRISHLYISVQYGHGWLKCRHALMVSQSNIFHYS